MKSRFYLAGVACAASIALTAAPAAAQFTTFVPPARPAAVDTATPQAVAVARSDSAQAQAITDMKVWVDSAARALAVNVDTAMVDSLVVDSLAGDVVQQSPRGGSTTSFSEGAPAPDTATMFPMLALAALSCVGAGVILLRRGGA